MTSKASRAPLNPPRGTPPAPTALDRSAEQQKRDFVKFLGARNLKLTKQREAVVDEIFTKPGHFEAEEIVLRLKCDVHRWMFTYVTVTDHPYAAVSGKDGTFAIKNVPPGKYTLVAMHRKAALAGVEQQIEVTSDGAKADFTLEAK